MATHHIPQTGTLMAFVFLTGVFAKVNITISPESLTFTSDQVLTDQQFQVNVTCRFAHASILSMDIPQELSISRSLRGSKKNSTIVSARFGASDRKAQLLLRIAGAAVSGSLAEQAISLSLNKATCHDAATYNCSAEILFVFSMPEMSSTSFTDTEHAVKNLTVNVTPGQLSMTASPQRETPWTVNEVLNMTCEGPVGTVQSEQQVEWVWQYHNESDLSWNSYDGNPSDVSSDVIEAPDNVCYQQGRSTLTLTLTLSDSKRWYRCYVRIGGVSFGQFAAKYRIGVVESATERPQSPLHPSLSWGLGVMGIIMVIGAAGLALALRRSCKKRADSRPLLLHRDPGWYTYYYGEYLEPINHVPQEEGEERSHIYTEIPNHFEEADLDTKRDNHSSPDTSLKQVEVTGQADFTSP